MTTGNKSDKKSFIEQKKYKIHDDFFTESMSNMDLAKEFLEKFLDANILEKIDLSSLVKMPDKYVTKDGKKYFTDALYSVKYDKKREGLLYILMEHKSYPAKEVIFQLLEYMAQIYQQHYDKTSGKVPLVFPVVIYHGKSKWKFDNEFLNYVDVDKEEDKELLKYIPNFIYKLYDVPRMEISREDFSNELKSFVLTLRLKNHTDELRELIKALDKVERQDWGIKIFKYIEEILDQGNQKKLEEIVLEENLKRRDEFMTIAQSYRQEGRILGIEEGIEKGITLGRQEGIEEGIEKTKVETAQNLFKLGIDLETISKATDLSIEKIKKVIKK